MQTPVAAEAGLERQHAGQAGVQQVHALLRTCKGIIDACQAMQPAAVKPEAGPGPSSSAEVTEKLASLQREYASTLGAIRATMQQCRELEQQDQQASAAGSSGGGAGTDEEAQLEARCLAVRQRLEDTNQLVKQMIDRLRLLLDALNMWDAHQTQLAQASAAQQ